MFLFTLLPVIIIYVPYLFTYKAHSLIRRTLNFRRRLWQVSKIKISPKYPVIRRNQNYGKIFSNYAKHSSSFLWSKLQVEDRSGSRSREQQPWNCSRIRNIPGECRFLYTRRPGWTKKVCYFSFIVFGVFNSGHDNFIERFVVTFASFRESEVRNLFKWRIISEENRHVHVNGQKADVTAFPLK